MFPHVSGRQDGIVEQGTLGKTLLRLKERAPQCIPFIDLYLKDYLSDDQNPPPPEEFLDLVTVIHIGDQVMDARRKLFIVGFLTICTVSAVTDFNANSSQMLESTKQLFDKTYGTNKDQKLY